MNAMLRSLALSISLAAAAPALAGGPTISFGYSAQNGDEAVLMRGMMAAYNLVRDHEANGRITDAGYQSALQVMTNTGNVVIVDQQGDGHTGSVVTRGDDNKCALIQRGHGAFNHLAPAGGETCFLFGFGLR